MSKSRSSPRKFSEKIALLNKKEAEGNAEFEKIIKEVEETTRASPNITSTSSAFPSRTSSFSNSSWNDDSRSRYIDEYQPQHHTHLNHHPELHQQPTSSFDNQGYISSGGAPTCGNAAISHYLGSDETSSLSLEQQQPHLHHHHHLTPSSASAPPPRLQTDHLSIQTPLGVPNIEIFPINDDNDYQQQILETNTNISNSYSRLECSNTISATRSLPDIANLRVSSGSFTALAPAYSDPRIPNGGYDFSYDANSNIVTNSSAQDFCSPPVADSQPQLQESWQHQVSPSEVSELQHHTDSGLPQTMQQSYYSESHATQLQGAQIVRASSTNAVQNGCWQNYNNDLLNTPRINNNLSKSTEFCYTYPQEYTDT